MTSASTSFQGFGHEGLAFLGGIAADNSKRYFDAHRAAYARGLLEPAKAFVLALGELLHERVGPGIVADPRVNGSIFRINRDTRFSADKTPYKAHLDFAFWEGEGRGRELPALHVRLAPDAIVLGGGMHAFSAAARARYRDAVAAEGTGSSLAELLGALSADPGVRIGGADAYRRVPRGHDPEGPRADLLRYGGLFAHRSWPLPPELHRPGLVPWVAERLEPFVPLHRWLVAHVAA